MNDCIYCGGVIGESCFDPQKCQEMAHARDNKLETQRDSLVDLTVKLQAHLTEEIKRADERIEIYENKGFVWQRLFTEGQRDALGGVRRVLNDLCLSNVKALAVAQPKSAPFVTYWSPEQPTQEGWYWLLRGESAKVVPVTRQRAFGDRFGAYVRPEGLVPITEIQNALWAGPIPNPSEP